MKQLLFSLLLLCCAAGGSAQDDVCRKSTEGTEFWFGFMESRHHQEDHYLEITVTSAEPATFHISVGSCYHLRKMISRQNLNWFNPNKKTRQLNL